MLAREMAAGRADRMKKSQDGLDVRARFDQVYEAQFRRVFRYIRFSVGANDAEDLTAQTFLKAFDRFERFDERKGSIETWLLALARNVVRDYQRRSRRWLWQPLELIASLTARQLTPEDHAITSDLESRLLRLVRGLATRERDVISLKFGAGVSNREIAGLHGLSESHVAVIVYRALGKLRKQLREPGEHADG